MRTPGYGQAMAGHDREIRVFGERHETIDAHRIAGVPHPARRRRATAGPGSRVRPRVAGTDDRPGQRNLSRIVTSECGQAGPSR